MLTGTRLAVVLVFVVCGGAGCAGSDDSLTQGRVTSSGGPDVQAARTQAYNGPKARIAVATFEEQGGTELGGLFAELRRSRRSRDSGASSASGFSDMLSTILFQSNRYIVLERERLDVVLAEQDLAAAGRVTQETAAPVGAVEGAELLVVGSVTGFEDNVSTDWWSTFIPVAGFRTKTQTSRIAMDVRLVDAKTGRLLAATSVEGTAKARASAGGTVLIGGAGGKSVKGPKEMAARKALQAAADWIISQTPAQYFHD